MNVLIVAVLLFLPVGASAADDRAQEPSVVAEGEAAPVVDMRTNQEKLTDPDPQVRLNALLALEQEKKPANLPAIKKLLTDTDPGVAKTAVAIVSRSGGDTAADALISAYNRQSDVMARSAILEALGKMRSKKSVPFLLGVLKDTYPGFRSGALRSLTQINDTSSYDRIVEMLSDGDAGVVVAASRAAGQLKITAASPSLQKNLASLMPVVRKASVQALGELQDQTAIEPLKKMVSDPDPAVVRAVRPALERIDPAAAQSLLPAVTDSAVQETPQKKGKKKKTLPKK